MPLLRQTMKLLVSSTALSILISGCSHMNDGQSSKGTSSACSHNYYLQKYNCSIVKVRAAAEQGDADAEYALGYMYYYGIDTASNQSAAKLWFRRAAAQGQPLAVKALHMLRQSGSLGSGSNYHSSGGSSSGSSSSESSEGYSSSSHHSGKHSTAGGTADEGAADYQAHTYSQESADQLNQAKPAGNINDQLPNYNKNKSANSAPPAIKSLQKDANATPSAPSPTDSQSMMNSTENKMPLDRASLLGGYTVQLLATNDLDWLKKYVTQKNLQDKTNYYSAQYHGQSWYMLTYGKYHTKAEANAAIMQLSASMPSLRPWVKSVNLIQKEMRLNRIL